MGIVETVPGIATSPTGLKVLNDPILSDGSLFLFDPSHSLGAFAGIPTNGQLVKNIACETAMVMMGTSNEDDVSIYMSVQEVASYSSNYIHERSGKGGLSGQYSHTNLTGNSSALGLGARANIPMRDYMRTLAGVNDLYFSVWFNMSRAANFPSAPQPMHHFAMNTSNYVFFGGNNGATDDALTYRSATYAAGQEDVGPLLWALQASELAGTTTGLEYRGGPGAVSSWSYGNGEKPLCGVLERMYCEDLTVSGRTFADVLAIDQELYAAAHAAGGAWFGDTFTDPTSFD